MSASVKEVVIVSLSGRASARSRSSRNACGSGDSSASVKENEIRLDETQISRVMAVGRD